MPVMPPAAAPTVGPRLSQPPQPAPPEPPPEPATTGAVRPTSEEENGTDTIDYMRELSSLGTPEEPAKPAPTVTRRVLPLKETKRKRRFWG